MQQQEIHQYLLKFFKTNQCEIIDDRPGYLSIKLTNEMDKELMNRPFYWHYLEKTGGEPNPMQVSFLTDTQEASKDLKGEIIHFGAPRLHQIFDTTQKLGSYIRLFEHTIATNRTNTPLHPWLGLNVTVSYQSDMKKDLVYSIGLHLINGAIVENFQDKLDTMNLTPKIPDYCFTMSPIIKPQSGINRIQQYISRIVEQDNHDWAEDAKQRWNADLMLLNHFYEELDEKPEVYHIEKEALRELYEPIINVSIINGGIFYLNPRVSL